VALTTKELSPKTWPDFEAFFGKYRGVRGACWCTYHVRRLKGFDDRTHEGRYALRKALVLSGQAHGVIVYDDGEPVAWCQYGPVEELPRPNLARRNPALAPPPSRTTWRITCIFTDKHRRKEGLAKFALHAALAAVRARGGGLVEAFPFEVPGKPQPSYTGSVPMFEREGFRRIAKLGSITVLMRKTVRGA